MKMITRRVSRATLAPLLSRRISTALPMDDGAGQWRLRGPHDVGGQASLLQGPLDISGRAPAFWECRTHALLVELAATEKITVDELRRGIEELDEQRYRSWGYYDKWAVSIATIALERGLLTEEELDDALGRDRGGAATSFAVGDPVRVLHDTPGAVRWRRPHLRCPGYVFGAVGVVERFVGVFDDPEFVAFRGSGPQQPLYRVRFTHAALGWGGEEAAGTASTVAASTVDVEVYGAWLEAADARQLAEDDAAAAALPTLQAAAECEQQQQQQPDRSTADSGRLGHAHGHARARARAREHEHEHGSRYEVEARAVEAGVAETPGERLSEALVVALTRNGNLDASRLQVAISKVEQLAAPEFSSGGAALGPRLVARAWVDAGFRRALLEDAQRALAECMGVDATNATAPTKLIAVANQADTHNLVVCTLCSCYPLSILGLSPSWYKDVKYRARCVRAPRALLAEFGTALPEGTAVRVHDSTADCRYLVLPERPIGTEEWSEAELAALVTRDSMIGVTLLTVPAGAAHSPLN
jgi:nitrile hydratase